MLHLKTSLDHLPPRKQREVELIKTTILQEFEAYRSAGTQQWRRNLKIHKIILFGSYARDDWVDWIKSRGNYSSDYDILVIVNSVKAAAALEIWGDISEKIMNMGVMRAPVEIFAEPLHFVNDSLKRGRFFFVDVTREGVAIYESNRGGRLVRPGKLSPELALEEANIHYNKWYESAARMKRGARFYQKDDGPNEAAFTLHQATEWMYHCVLLVLTNYTPDTHNLKHLRKIAEYVEPKLVEVWPRETKRERALFQLLKDAYVKARYSPHYKITEGELDYLHERVAILHRLVRTISKRRIKELEKEVEQGS